MRHNRVQVNKNNDKYHQSPHVGGIFVVVAIIASLLIPVLAVAEDEGTPEAPATSIEVQPTAVPTLPPPPPTAIPTQPPPPPPPTAVPTLPPPPPTAVPTVPPAPTAIPPTQAPAPAQVAPQPVVSEPEPTATVAPTATLAPSPTPSPTAVPSPTPSPTAIVWTNTDSLVMVDGATSNTLQPAAYATVTVRYGVTTPRVSTVIHAELTGDTRGWSLSSPALGDADAVATTAVWTQGLVVQPGTSFDLPIVVTAPANVTADQTVSLHLWSVTNTDHGQETGVAKIAQPYAQFTVIAPPPPTAVPSPTDVPVIGDEAMDKSVDEPDAGVTDATPDVSPSAKPEEGADQDHGNNEPKREEEPVASPVADPAKNAERSGTANVVVAASPMASPVAQPVGSKMISMASTSGEPNIGTCGELVGPNADGVYTAECPYPNGVSGVTTMWVLAVQGIDSCSVGEKSSSNCAQTAEDITGVGTGNNKKVTIKIRTQSRDDVYLKFSISPNNSETTWQYEIGTPTMDSPDSDDLTLTCAPDSVSFGMDDPDPEVTCTLSGEEDLSQAVTIPKLRFNVPEGMTLTFNDTSVTGPGQVIELDDVSVAANESYAIEFTLERTACVTDDAIVDIATWFTWDDNPNDPLAGPGRSVTTTFKHAAVPISIGLEPFAFDPMTWDGDKWATANGTDTTTGTGAITVSREGCGNMGSSQVQVRVIDRTHVGLNPMVKTASVSPNAVGLMAVGGGGNPNGENTVGVANVATDFNGTEVINVDYTLTPENDVPADEHTMTIRVTLSTGD